MMTNLSRTSQDAVYKIHCTGNEHTCFSFFKNNLSVTEVEDLEVPALISGTKTGEKSNGVSCFNGNAYDLV